MVDIAETFPWVRVEATMATTSRMIRAAFDGALAPLDLNLTSASLLAYVADFGPVSQTALAEKLGVGRAAAGAVVDRLEARQLIERVADEHDRRVWLITITSSGRRLAGQVAVVDEEVREQIRSGISRLERQQLAALLVRIQKNLGNGGLEVGHQEVSSNSSNVNNGARK